MDLSFVENGINQLVEKMQGWGVGIIEMLPNLALAVLIVIVFFAIARWVENMVRKALNTGHVNANLEQLLGSVVRTVVIFLGIVLALGVLDLQKTVFSMLAGVGVLGLALGFAFQDLAANFVSGVMLAVRSPIEIGQVVKIGDTQGTVQEIRLRDTVILNFSGQEVFIPNKEFTSNRFINYSSHGERRIDIGVGVGYEDDVEKAVEIVKSALGKVPNILQEPAPEAYTEELAGSSVNISGRVWFKYPGDSFLQIRNDALIQVKKDLEEAGFNIPFPIRTLDIDDKVIEKLAGAKQNNNQSDS